MRSTYAALARDALPHWGFSDRAQTLLVNLSENATFRVWEGSRTAMLRVHRAGYHDRVAIESELSWMAALRADLGLRTPVHVPTKAGAPVVTLADDRGRERHAVLFEVIDGTEPPPDDLERHLPGLGAVAARMHAHVQTWQPPAEFTRFRWDVPATLGADARWGRWQHAPGVDGAALELLGRASRTAAERLADFGYSADRFGLIHADMRLANLLVAQEVAVIDFDDSGFCWYLYDLAATLSFVEDDPRVPAWCAAWLRGYEQVRPLSVAERAMLPTFIVLRRLMLLAWLGSHHFTETARQLAPTYAAGTCALAETYLAGTGWAAAVLR